MGRRILIFEDNPNIQVLLKVFFSRRGYEPLIFEDPIAAVPLAQEHAPALILMDIIMPGKDGVSACADLRRAGVTTPVVMLTSKDLADDRERAKKAGANGYLLKPFNPSEIEAAVQPFLK